MTTDPPLFLQCGHAIEPVQMGAARRCMVPLNQHDGLDHEYVSLMVPCVGCDAALKWKRDAWRDSMGNIGVGNRHTHAPKPGWYVA